MANVPNCPKCTHFVLATDPQIVKAYAGACTKLEWPYNINIPREDGIEGDCGYYEGAGPAAVAKWDLAAIAGAKAKVAEVDTSTTKVEYYFDSSKAPGSAFPSDAKACADLIGKLKAKGINAVAIDLKGQPNPAKQYNAACAGPKAEIRGVFGAKGALEEDFGRTVPALLVYGKNPVYPRAVFPRSDKALQRVLGPDEALKDLAK